MEAASTTSGHVLTIDVEEYYQAPRYRDLLVPAEWKSLPERAENCVETLLHLLERHGQRATFFVGRWVTEQTPELIARIDDAGHEVGVRGVTSRPEEWETEEQFRSRLSTLKTLVDAAVERPVRGFRGGHLTRPHERMWLYDALIDEGFSYDSSVRPALCRREDHARDDRGPYAVRRSAGTVYELPWSATTVFGFPVTAAHGRCLRQLPYRFTRSVLREYAESGAPAVVALRSWEVDPEQPELGGSIWRRLAHRAGLGRTVPVLERLFSEFEFSPAREALRLTGESVADRARPAPADRTSRLHNREGRIAGES